MGVWAPQERLEGPLGSSMPAALGPVSRHPSKGSETEAVGCSSWCPDGGGQQGLGTGPQGLSCCGQAHDHSFPGAAEVIFLISCLLLSVFKKKCKKRNEMHFVEKSERRCFPFLLPTPRAPCTAGPCPSRTDTACSCWTSSPGPTRMCPPRALFTWDALGLSGHADLWRKCAWPPPLSSILHFLLQRLIDIGGAGGGPSMVSLCALLHGDACLRHFQFTDSSLSSIQQRGANLKLMSNKCQGFLCLSSPLWAPLPK